MGRFLQALAWVAPGAALARLHASAAVRAYDGANPGRRGASFKARDASANQEIGRALPLLRSRSRELARNTWIGARMLDVLTSHVVGHGVAVRFNTGAKKLDQRVQALWDEWRMQADVERVLDFDGLVALAFRAAMEGGDSIVRLVPRKLTGDRKIPLALQVAEGDLIDESRDAASMRSDAQRTRLGVELGEWDERVGLWLRPSLPGEPTRNGLALAESVFVSRADVCHLYRPLRPGQVRGVPLMAPIMQTARDFADLLDAVVVKARMEACIGLIVTSSDTARGLAGQVAKGGEERIDKLRPGMIANFAPGDSVTPFAPSSSGQFEPVALSALMGIASGGMVTYDQLTGDLRQANYSSLRAGKIEFRRLVDQLQWQMLIPMLIDRIVDRFIATAILAGLIQQRAGGYPRTYVPPAHEPIDPMKDLTADILAVRAGRMSPQDFIGAWGRDWREVLAEHQEFFDAADAMRAVFDIDARKVTQAGALQADASDDEADGKPKPKPKG